MKALRSVVAALAVAVGVGAAPLVAPEAPVADAAQQGDLEQIRALIKSGADVNAPQGDGMTALHWAAQNGDAGMAELLLYAGANPGATTRLGAYTPLHLASASGRVEVTRALIRAGARVQAATATGATPLHLAADAGSAELVGALIEGGALVNATESYALRTPLMFAAARNRVEAVRALLAGGADANLTTRVVDYAERASNDQKDQEERERRVAAARGEPAEQPPQGRGGGGGGGGQQPPPDQGTARPLNYDDLVGKQGGLAAIHYAARDGYAETVMALLDAGVDVNLLTAGDRSTPLLVAVINGNFDMARTLVERGGDPNAASEDGVAPLFAAINTQWNLRTWYPQPTAYQQQETSYLELMEGLLGAGADPNARLTQHLWYSAYNAGRMGVDYMGATAFWRAAYATDVEAMKLLVAYGADPHIPTMKPPGGGGRRGGDDGDEDPSGLPPVPAGGPGVYPIHAATGVGFGTSRVGQQHRSVPDGWLPAVKYLVDELGADVNVRDHEGFSAVHHAAARGDNEVILFLVEHGADVTGVSRRGQTTVDMANGPQQRVQPFPETIALLESLGAKNNNKCLSC